MTIRRTASLVLLLLTLAGCGTPVPPDKAAYAGEWQAPNMYLLITPDGSVRYERLEGGVTSSIEAPLKGFVGDDFEVGIGPMSTIFRVARPPYRDGGGWKMEVDGVQLTRTDA